MRRTLHQREEKKESIARKTKAKNSVYQYMVKLLGNRINLISMILKASLEQLDWKKEIIISFTKDA